MIVEPLGLYEVPPRGDGAACVVIASEDYARRLNVPYVAVRSRAFHHEGVHQIGDVPADMIGFAAAAAAAQAGFEAAGLGPDAVDVAELYAPCTIVEVLASEAAGFVPRGEGAYAAARGVTALGGRIPIGTSGGLTSRGHPSYATPLYSVVELADQLRGRAGARQVDGARIGFLMNELGNYNAALVHVLETVG